MRETVISKSSISHAGAQRAAEAAIAKAVEINVPSVVSIVDESGIEKFFIRMDGAGLASVEVARNKAYTALSTGMETHSIHGVALAVPELGYGLPSVPRLTAIAGGLLLRMDDIVIGAIGVSGGTLDDDVSVAAAGVAALSRPDVS